MTHHLENLSNEVFHEIFDYLDGYDMLKAFSKLNHRFQTLINHSSIPLKLNYYSRKSILMEDYYEEIIYSNRDRLLSLQLINNRVHNDLLDYFTFDASFTRLECLKLENLLEKNLLANCSCLKSLPRLHYLYISVNEKQYSPQILQILCLIVSLPVLKRCIFLNAMELGEHIPDILLSIATNSKPSSIEYLTIRDVASPRTIVSLLDHLPNIRRLECQFFGEFDEITDELKGVNLPHLRHLSIQNSSLRFDQVEALIQIVGHHVEFLKVYRYSGKDYIDAERWKRLIKMHLPLLKSLDLKCENICHYNINSIHDCLDPFHSQFWIEHQWFSSVSFNQYSMTFHIHPYE